MTGPPNPAGLRSSEDEVSGKTGKLNLTSEGVMKEIISKSYEMGYQACPKINSSPYNNSDFMKILPNCEFGDDNGMKLRTKMYKSYIKGWTDAHLDKVWNLD